MALNQQLYSDHSRIWENLRYIYPVVSRRAGGVSLGINLNIDKVCNFGCIYCEVNRAEIPLYRNVDIAALESELSAILALIKSDSFFNDPRFSRLWMKNTAPQVRDIAFSGDGEPTAFRNFAAVVHKVIQLRNALELQHIPITLITNASMFHRESVLQAIKSITGAGGEIWAKLDAGSPEYFRQINRAAVPFDRILQNITTAGKVTPLILQSCFMRVAGIGPERQEIAEYIQRIHEFAQAGARISRIQVYTVTRPPADRTVTSLNKTELEAICAQISAALPNIPAQRYDGFWSGYDDNDDDEAQRLTPKAN